MYCTLLTRLNCLPSLYQRRPQIVIELQLVEPVVRYVVCHFICIFTVIMRCKVLTPSRHPTAPTDDLIKFMDGPGSGACLLLTPDLTIQIMAIQQ
jgi:hypothetical protein